MMGSGLALATQITQPWHLYLTLGFLVSGGSLCLGYTGHALFLPHWFARQRGLAMGIAFSGVGIGSIVLLPWAQHLITTRGWRTACVGLAVVMFAVLIPLNAIFPRRRPEDMGLLPDGARGPTGGHARGRPANIVDPVWAATDWTLARAMRTARFWWVFIGFFTGLFAWYAIQVHQTKYLIDIGFRPEPAAYALGLVALVGVVGQILMGHLSDRFGREPIWALGCAGFVACFLFLLAMRTAPTTPLLWAMVLCQGVLGYGMASVFAAIPAELFQGPALRQGLRHALARHRLRVGRGPLGGGMAPRPHRRLCAGVRGGHCRERDLGDRDLARGSAQSPAGGGTGPSRALTAAHPGRIPSGSDGPFRRADPRGIAHGRVGAAPCARRG